jgi:hypothetical protein
MAMAIKDKKPDQSHLPPNVSPFIKDTIERLLSKNPDERPDAETLVY